MKKMIPDRNAIRLFRFSEHRWVNSIIKGELSFSCAGLFVEQATITKNDIQGDCFEAVFARLKRDDPRIAMMQSCLGSDLETISDNEYVLLRRKSAMLKPIFCIYCYKAKDALSDCGEKIHLGINTVTHEFDPNMFSGFSVDDWKSNVIADDRRPAMLILQPVPFIAKVIFAININKLSYIMRDVDYETRAAETFFIPPTNNYDELFYKRAKYSYQHERRVCLIGKTFRSYHERYPLKMQTLNKGEFAETQEKLLMKLDVNILDRTKLSKEDRKFLEYEAKDAPFLKSRI